MRGPSRRAPARQTGADRDLDSHRNRLRRGLRSFPFESHVIFYLPLIDGADIVRVIHGFARSRYGMERAGQMKVARDIAVRDHGLLLLDG